MKLSRLIEEHQKYQSHGLVGNFGDGYLMVKNKVFRHIREAAVKNGFQFSMDRNEAYESFPLLQLESLLATKILPYSNNLAAFSGLSSIQRGLLTWEDVDGNLKKNFVLHEACHGVVRQLMTEQWPESAHASGLLGERQLVLRMLLEESCSNTCELFGLLDAEDQIHRIFYEMNSYNSMFEQRGLLKKAVDDLGLEPVMRFMLLAYLLSNFLRPGVSDDDFKRMLRAAGLNALELKSQKGLRGLAKIASQLNERFRIQTMAFHLRLKGVQTPMREILDFDVLAQLEQEPGADRVIAAFVARLI